jgi:hypothetical protein
VTRSSSDDSAAVALLQLYLRGLQEFNDGLRAGNDRLAGRKPRPALRLIEGGA